MPNYWYWIATLVSLVVLSPASADQGVVATGSKLQQVWSEGEFTEGGAWSPNGTLLFADIGNRILQYEPGTGRISVYREPSGRANGMLFDRQGRLFVAEGANSGGGRRVSVTEPDGTVRTWADRYQGKAFNSPNDLAIDAQGRIYMSDPRYVGAEPRELEEEGVYRIDPDGQVSKLETGASKPNGLALSPDGKTLYVADNGPRRRALLALSLDESGTPTGRPRVLKDFGNGHGIDGMTVAADGRIVCAASAGKLAGVYVYEPSGVPVGFIATPETPSNVELGGANGRTLFITAGKSLYQIETTLEAFRP